MPEQKPRRTAAPRRAASGTVFARRAQRRRERENAPETPVAEVTPEEIERRERAARLSRSILRPSRGQLLVAAVLLLFGVTVGAQVRSRTADTTYEDARREDLVQLLDAANQETRKLESELTELRTTRDRLQSGADSAKVAEAESQKRLDSLGILAGTVGASGPGVRITVLDPQSKLTASMLLDAVEELRDAGAEVIEINDSIRVVGSTWFADGKQGLVVDGKAVGRPIVIDAIGDPQALEGAARFRGGLMSQVQASAVAGSVTISRPTTVTVTALHEVKANQNARPA